METPCCERNEFQMRNIGYGKGDKECSISRRTTTPRAIVAALNPGSSSSNLPTSMKEQCASKECDNMASDKSVVEYSVKEQQGLTERTLCTGHPFQVSKFNKDIDADYEMLSSALRMNIRPGYTINHQISATKEAYNDQVHLFREPYPDQWRYRKDDLSKWAEHNVIRQKTTKAWEQYFVEHQAKNKVQ